MDRWQNKIAVVTGASAGIGAAIVKELVKAGLIVVGLARRTDRVEELKKDLPKSLQDNLHVHSCDVRKSESVNAAFDWIITKFGGVDVMINNAGFYRPGQLVNMPLEDLETTIGTNVLGVLYCTQRAFKSMKDRGVDGHVIMINSITGHAIPPNIVPDAPPMSNMYPPTKHALTAMNEIYRQEFKGLGTNCKVTSLSPGFVDTDMLPSALKAAMVPVMLTPDDVAATVVYVLGTPPHVQIHELTVKPIGELL